MCITMPAEVLARADGAQPEHGELLQQYQGSRGIHLDSQS